MSMENSEEIFCTSWDSWEDAILGYANASGHKSVGLKHALRDWSHLQMTAFAHDSDSEDDYSIYGIIYQLLLLFTFVLLILDPLTKTITAIRCLAHFLTTKEKKKGKDKDDGSYVDTPYVLKECPVSCYVHECKVFCCDIFCMIYCIAWHTNNGGY